MYHVIHKETSRMSTLLPDQVNDMFEDEQGRIIICDTHQELYWLLVSKDLLER